MNKPTRCLSSLFVSSFLFLGTAATAEETRDLLDLSAHLKGDGDDSFQGGTNVVVGQDEQTGKKYVTGVDGKGVLNIPVDLKEDFDIVVKLNCYQTKSSSRYIYLTLIDEADREYQVALRFWGYDTPNYKEKHVILTAGKTDNDNTDKSGMWKDSDTDNEVKLSVDGTMAEVYVNGLLSQQLPLKTGMNYTLLRFGDLTATDQLYELTLTTNGSDKVILPTSFDAGKLAGIEQCQMDPASCGITMGGGEQLGVIEHLQAFYDYFFANRGVNFNYPGNLVVPYEIAPEWQMDETLGYTVYLNDSNGNPTAYFDIAFTPTPP